MVSLIVAMDKHGLIGKEGGLPWHCPADMAHFKERTMHHTILMGRTTYEHIRTPLKERTIYVASTAPMKHENTIHVCHDVDALLNSYKNTNDILYVCGGASIYKQALAYIDELWISYIEGDYMGDTWFPIVLNETFREVMKQSCDGFVLVHYIVHK